MLKIVMFEMVIRVDVLLPDSEPNNIYLEDVYCGRMSPFVFVSLK